MAIVRETEHQFPIVFFGSGPVAAASLDYISRHFAVEVVITKSVPPHHKGVAPVEELSNKLKLPTLFASNKTDLDDLIDSHKFKSNLGIIVDYGVIVSQKVISTFQMGIVNSHFSLLPEWRGADPITFSILSGQPKTGVSLMLIEPSLDTGKLIAQKSLCISPNDTTASLTSRLIELSNKLLNDYLPRYISGDVRPKKQPHPDQATYSRKLTKKDGLIDWSKSASEIEREIRAYSDWPRSRTNLGGKILIITKAHIKDCATNKLDVLCGDNRYLSIDELIAPSGRRMPDKDFLNGYKV